MVNTADLSPAKYKSWIEFWRAHKGKGRKTCAVTNCHNKDLSGAHVVNVYGTPVKNGYIIPLCNICHGKTNDTFMIDSNLLVKIEDKDTAK